MDFLNRGFAQLSELFRTMTPGARIMAGLLLVIVVVSVGYLFNHQIAGPDAYLMGGQSFSANELPAMEAAFAKANLNGYSLEGARIRIPRAQQAAYMGALADAGALPANFGDYMLKAVSDKNPFLTGPQREEMIKIGQQLELVAIIRSIPGIEQASVMFDTKQKPGLRREKFTTASVSVKPRGSAILEEDRVPMIRHLVSASLAIPSQNVTVIDLNGRTYPGEASGEGGGLDDPYLAKQRKWQEMLVGELSRALNYVPGVTVGVNVEIDRKKEHTDETVKVDPKAVAVTTREESTSSEADRGGPQGRAGLAAQQPNQPANLAASAPSNRSTEEKASAETQNAIGHSSKTIKYYGGTPERITVSIGVPDSYFTKVFRSRNPTPEGQEETAPEPAALTKIEQEITGKIRAHVSGLIPIPEGVTDPSALVTVTSFTHLPQPELPPVSTQDQAVAWLGANWSTLGLVGLGLFSLMMLRSMVRAPMRGPSRMEMPSTIPFPSAATGQQGGAPLETVPAARKRTSEPTLRDQLADMVKDDPAVAADILRNWISNAS